MGMKPDLDVTVTGAGWTTWRNTPKLHSSPPVDCRRLEETPLVRIRRIKAEVEDRRMHQRACDIWLGRP